MAQVPGRTHPKVGQDQVSAYIAASFSVYHWCTTKETQGLISQDLDMTQ